MSALLEIKDLSGGYTQGIEILHGINMTIQSGETVGIIGLNGSGKSTIAAAIMNLLPFRKGSIVFKGEDITYLPAWQLSNQGIAIMQQGGRVFPSLSVWEHMELVLGQNTKNRVEQLAEIIPLLANTKSKLRHMMGDRMSGGQKHQLALAMTMAQNPRFVILDEPSAGLSPRSIDEMYTIIDSICSKASTAVLLIEQVVAKAVEHCDRCLLVQLGTIVREFIHPSISEVDNAMFDSYVTIHKDNTDNN